MAYAVAEPGNPGPDMVVPVSPSRQGLSLGQAGSSAFSVSCDGGV